MQTELNNILDVAKEAAYKAGDIAKSVRASGSINLKMKGELDLVTEADIKAEKAIIETIKNYFPTHSFLAEESNSSFSPEDFNKPLWIIDPIDGTTNYAHGHPHVGTSIAYSEGGVVKAAVVNAPFYDEIFYATKNGGAFLNDKRIQVGDCNELKSALVATGFPYEREEIAVLFRYLELVIKNCRDLRRIGAASLDICWVACGRLDIYYENVLPWDMAAGALIAREAGCAVRNFDLNPGHSALDYMVNKAIAEKGKIIFDKNSLPSDLNCVGVTVCNEKLIGKFLELLA